MPLRAATRVLRWILGEKNRRDHSLLRGGWAEFCDGLGGCGQVASLPVREYEPALSRWPIGSLG